MIRSSCMSSAYPDQRLAELVPEGLDIISECSCCRGEKFPHCSRTVRILLSCETACLSILIDFFIVFQGLWRRGVDRGYATSVGFSVSALIFVTVFAGRAGVIHSKVGKRSVLILIRSGTYLDPPGVLVLHL